MDLFKLNQILWFNCLKHWWICQSDLKITYIIFWNLEFWLLKGIQFSKFLVKPQHSSQQFSIMVNKVWIGWTKVALDGFAQNTLIIHLRFFNLQDICCHFMPRSLTKSLNKYKVSLFEDTIQTFNVIIKEIALKTDDIVILYFFIVCFLLILLDLDGRICLLL